MNTIIESNQILLRKFVIEDYKSVFEFGSNVEVQKYNWYKIVQ